MRMVANCARLAEAVGLRVAEAPLPMPLMRPLATAQFIASLAKLETFPASEKADRTSSATACSPS